MTRGFLVVDKPRGMTSNAVVGRVKRATGIKKVGHAGTLDPLATGVVVVAVGPVTRLIRFIQEQPKEYLATAQFGVSTDTLDSDGAVLTREPMEFTEEELEDVASRFVGTVLQVPPMVSALKHQGRRLYELARQGEVVEREARPVEIHELEIESVGAGPYPEVEFRVVCGKGTYVRSLADDLAAALGGSAHLTALRRTRTGSLDVETARGPDRRSGPVGVSFPHAVAGPRRSTGRHRERRDGPRGVCHGMQFVGGEMVAAPDHSVIRVLDQAGDLIAVYRRDGEQARPEVVLAS